MLIKIIVLMVNVFVVFSLYCQEHSHMENLSRVSTILPDKKSNVLLPKEFIRWPSVTLAIDEEAFPWFFNPIRSITNRSNKSASINYVLFNNTSYTITLPPRSYLMLSHAVHKLTIDIHNVINYLQIEEGQGSNSITLQTPNGIKTFGKPSFWDLIIQPEGTITMQTANRKDLLPNL